MANSLNIAMFLAIYFAVLGVALLINSKSMLSAVESMLKDKGLCLIVGFMALIFGSFIVSFHGFYAFKWQLIITIFGWLAVLKGVVYLVFPDSLKRIAKFYKTTKVIQINAVIILLFALFFAYKVFCNC